MALDSAGTLALLIDGDNATPKIIAGLLAEIANYGTASVKRIYGDWTKPNLNGWKECLLEHSIQPVQQFAYTSGKNATDGAMIIDAMDLLYTGDFDGFCLVTSDSDFTGLATRLREAGLMVFGFGERKTPEAFRNACHRFVFVEVLRAGDRSTETDDPEPAEPSGSKRRPRKAAKPPEPETSPAKFPKKFVMSALEQSVDDSGWADLGTFGRYLVKLQPDFDSRLYGHRKLSDLVRSRTDLFQTEERQTQGSSQRSIYVRAT